MAINFPNSPSNGQIYTLGSRSWTWSNTGGFWQATSATIGYTGSQGSGYTGSQGTTGFVGSQGNLGYTGSKGATGDFGGAAFNYTFSTNTTHTSTPNGYFNFNNTAFNLATSLFIDYIDNLGANSYSFLQTIDDSTSAIKGHFSIRDVANSLNYAMFSITGSHTEDVDHFDVPISYLSGVTSFVDGTNTIVTFARTGNIGDTGYVGSRGDLGYTGSIGPTGYVGSQGSQGSTGYDGSQGSLGYTGSTGFTGSTGVGYAGSTGYDGSQGSLGYTGSVGTGYVGSQGIVGYTGSAGTGGGSGGFSNGQSISVANLVVTANLISTNQVSGSVLVTGGVGVTDSLYVGNRIGIGNNTNRSAFYMYYNANTDSLDMVYG